MNYDKAQELYLEYNAKIRALQIEFAEALKAAGYNSDNFTICMGLDVPMMVYPDKVSENAVLDQEIDNVKYYKVEGEGYTVIEVV